MYSCKPGRLNILRGLDNLHGKPLCQNFLNSLSVKVHSKRKDFAPEEYYFIQE